MTNTGGLRYSHICNFSEGRIQGDTEYRPSLFGGVTQGEWDRLEEVLVKSIQPRTVTGSADTVHWLIELFAGPASIGQVGGGEDPRTPKTIEKKSTLVFQSTEKVKQFPIGSDMEDEAIRDEGSDSEGDFWMASKTINTVSATMKEQVK